MQCHSKLMIPYQFLGIQLHKLTKVSSFRTESTIKRRILRCDELFKKIGKWTRAMNESTAPASEEFLFYPWHNGDFMMIRGGYEVEL